MKNNKTKIIAGLLSALAAVLPLRAQQYVDAYSASQLKREQIMFKGYLGDSEKNLAGAKRRLENGNCPLATAAVLAALAEKDVSKLKQYRYLERIQQTSGYGLLTAVAEARRLTDRYNNDVVPETQTTEEDLDRFIKNSLSKQCPESMSLINRYRDAVSTIDPGDPSAIDKLADAAKNLEAGGSAETAVSQVEKAASSQGGSDSTANRITGGTDRPGSDADRTIDRFVGKDNPTQQDIDELGNALKGTGLSPDQIDALKRAIANHDWPAAEKILQDNDSPQARKLLDWVRAQERGSASATGVEQDSRDWSDWDSTGQRHRALANYPQGKKVGTISGEVWQTEDRLKGMLPDVTRPWDLIIKADSGAKGQASFLVENESSNDEKFLIDGWQLRKGDDLVQEATEPTFVVAYKDTGSYEVVARGHTEPYKFSFTVRQNVSYTPR